MSSPKEPASPDYVELVQDVDSLGCETDFEHLPKGYYWSRFFIGSMMATGLGLWAAVASFVRSITARETPRSYRDTNTGPSRRDMPPRF